MKKILVVLLFIVSLISFTGVKGEGLGSPFTEFYTYYPRFRYTTDTDGNFRAFAMMFEQDEDTGDITYKIDIEQLDNNGNVINLLATDYIDPEDPLTTGIYTDYIAYDWSDKSVIDILNENDIVFYRVVYNNSIILHTGGVMLRPEFTENESSRVEFGDYVYNSGGTVDSTDQSQFTYNINSENIIAFHYRFNSDIEVVGVDNYIMIRDLSTMTTEFAIDSSNILTLQGGSDINYRNSFIPIFISSTYPEFLRSDIIDTDYNSILNEDLEIGSYLVYLEGDTFTYITDSEATALLNISNLDRTFNLAVNYSSIDIVKKQKITFLKDNEESDSVYTTITAMDQGLLDDWSSDVDSVFMFNLAYTVLQTLEAGDITEVLWELEPTILPFSIPTSNYIISESGSYNIVGETDIGASITTSIDWFGWNNELGLVFVSVAILVIASLIMSALNVEIMVTLLVDGAILGMLSFIGFLPIWFLIGEVVIIALGIMLKFGRGGSE